MSPALPTKKKIKPVINIKILHATHPLYFLVGYTHTPGFNLYIKLFSLFNNKNKKLPVAHL